MSNSKTNASSDEQSVSMTEHLSALLDDEAGSFEQRRVLDELKQSDDLCKNLSHYALIGESMRSSQPVAVAGTSFLAGIHEKIDAEENYHDVQLIDQAPASNDKQGSWLKPVGGFALAASVAAVSVLSVQNYQLTKQQNAPVETIAVSQPIQKEQLTTAEMQSAQVVSADTLAPATSDKAKAVASTDKKYRQANSHARSFLKRYVDSHMQYASTSTFVPSVRVIAYADYK